jgi:hypothetical protein
MIRGEIDLRICDYHLHLVKMHTIVVSPSQLPTASSPLAHLLNSITMQVMLSQPMPPLLATSLAQISSSIYSTSTPRLSLPFFLRMFSCTQVTAACEERQSQMPSQAQIINSESLVSFSTKISGKAVMI